MFFLFDTYLNPEKTEEMEIFLTANLLPFPI